MRVDRPLVFEPVSQEQYDRLGRILHTEGLNLTGNKTEAVHDGISVRIEFDPNKSELKISTVEPHWMQPNAISGYYNDLVVRALYTQEAAPLPPSDKKPQDAKPEREFAIDDSHTEAANSDSREAHPDRDTKPGADRVGANERSPEALIS